MERGGELEGIGERTNFTYIYRLYTLLKNLNKWNTTNKAIIAVYFYNYNNILIVCHIEKVPPLNL